MHKCYVCLQGRIKSNISDEYKNLLVFKKFPVREGILIWSCQAQKPRPHAVQTWGSQSAEEEKRRRSLKKEKVRGCTQGKFKKNKDYFKLRIMERFSGKELKKWIWKLALLVIFKE